MLKKGSPLTKRASSRSRPIVSKAATISRLVLALRTWICSCRARAAASTPLNVGSTFGLVGLTSTANARGCGHHLTQEFQPFCRQFNSEKTDPCQIAFRSGEAGDKTVLHRVVANTEDDRDRRGCRFGRQRRSHTLGYCDHGDLPANQIGRQLRQPMDLILGPAVQDRNVLALDIAGVFQALAKAAQTVR